MADKKLRIPRKLKTETYKQLKIRTVMNSYAPYKSLIPLHGRKSWGKFLSLFLKIEGGGGGGGQNTNVVLLSLLALNLRKKTFLL